eukprot:1397010-Prymnesium_polylepis.1
MAAHVRDHDAPAAAFVVVVAHEDVDVPVEDADARRPVLSATWYVNLSGTSISWRSSATWNRRPPEE